MKKSLLIVGLLFFGLISLPSNAYKVYHQADDISCATWLKEVGSGDSVNAHQLSSWVFGFVSGVGAAGINLTETDLDSLRGFVTQHCQRYPADNIADGAQQLVAMLEKIKSKDECRLPFQIR